MDLQTYTKNLLIMRVNNMTTLFLKDEEKIIKDIENPDIFIQKIGYIAVVKK